MGQETVDSALLAELVRGTGLNGRWGYRPLGGVGQLNRHYLIEIGTRRFVARLYGWPFPDDAPFDRMAKEVWVLGALAGVSPVVPRVLATVRGEAGSGMLTNFLPGQVFGDLTDAPPQLWASVAAAFRVVHEATVPGVTTAGAITGEGVRPYPGGWGRQQVRQFREQARRLATHRPGLAFELERAIGIVAAAEPLLSARPVSLVHGDAHAWNVLVVRGRCTALLDWEFAEAGDGLVDIVRLDTMRIRPLGPTPIDLFRGHADHASQVCAAIYRLALHVWMANDARYFAHRPAYDLADGYLGDLAGELDRLESALD